MNELQDIATTPFFEFALILTLAAILGIVGQLFRQPLIVMFIALGILVGPTYMDIVTSHDKIHLLAEIGIALLLFIVGLKLDLRIIRSVGKVSLLTGLGQVIFTSLFGYFLGIALGFTSLHSFYIAVALTFSSTIIIVKLLSDKKEIDALHGQIAIGFLIVQDIVVILLMIILSALGQDAEISFSRSIINILITGTGLLAITYVAMKWFIPRLTTLIAKSQEMLLLFSISWAISFASLSELMGFSGEVGAFLAGISLTTSDFKDVISIRLVSLRDFLLLFFFVNLGANLDLSIIDNQIDSALVFSVFVLIGNPIIVLVIMGLMGYRKRTSFLAGLTVAQISEFSLIFAALGYSLGHISSEVVGLITLVGLVTIGLSTYMILYSHQIYKLLSRALSIFQRSRNYTEDQLIQEEDKIYDVVIIGLGRFGRRLAEIIDSQPGIRYLGVDFDPSVVNEWKEKGMDIIYGDMEDPDLLEQIPYQNSRMIVSTVANNELSQQLILMLRKNQFKSSVFVTAATKKDFQQLRSFGLEEKYILQPHKMAALQFYQVYLSEE